MLLPSSHSLRPRKHELIMIYHAKHSFLFQNMPWECKSPHCGPPQPSGPESIPPHIIHTHPHNILHGLRPPTWYRVITSQNVLCLFPHLTTFLHFSPTRFVLRNIPLQKLFISTITIVIPIWISSESPYSKETGNICPNQILSTSKPAYCNSGPPPSQRLHSAVPFHNVPQQTSKR